MASDRFLELERQVQELQRHLLPVEFEATGMYEDQECVRTRTLSFLVLAHAEIGAYFEDRIIQIAKSAWQAWRESKHLSRVAFCLVAFCGREMKRPPDSLSAPNLNKEKDWRKRLEIGERLGEVVRDFINAVQNQNHGVRERNLLSMLLPIGFHYADLDVTFLADIDSFGRRRGEAAHSSTSAGQVRQGIDPKTEFEQISSLLGSLRSVDQQLDYLLRDASAMTASSELAPRPEPESAASTAI